MYGEKSIIYNDMVTEQPIEFKIERTVYDIDTDKIRYTINTESANSVREFITPRIYLSKNVILRDILAEIEAHHINLLSDYKIRDTIANVLKLL